MSISESVLKKIPELLREYGAKRILLFGSMVDTPETARDIDVAVEGIPLNRPLRAGVELEEELGVPVDLVSMENQPRFAQIIQQYGRVLYEEGTTQAGSGF